MLLHTTNQGGKVGERLLRRRIGLFDSGEWDKLLQLAKKTLPTTTGDGSSKQDNTATTESKRITKVMDLVKQGELSHAARVISSNGLAPGDDNTYAELRLQTTPIQAIGTVTRQPPCLCPRGAGHIRQEHLRDSTA